MLAVAIFRFKTVKIAADLHFTRIRLFWRRKGLSDFVCLLEMPCFRVRVVLLLWQANDAAVLLGAAAGHVLQVALVEKLV